MEFNKYFDQLNNLDRDYNFDTEYEKDPEYYNGYEYIFDVYAYLKGEVISTQNNQILTTISEEDEEAIPIENAYFLKIRESLIKNRESISKKLNSELIDIDYDGEDAFNMQFYLIFKDKIEDNKYNVINTLKPYLEISRKGIYNGEVYKIQYEFNTKIIDLFQMGE